MKERGGTKIINLLEGDGDLTGDSEIILQRVMSNGHKTYVKINLNRTLKKTKPCSVLD